MSDLVTILAALCLLLATAVPMLRRAVAESNQVKCANNLKRIGLASLMYVNQDVHSGAYPRLYFDIAHPERVTNYTGFDSPDSFVPAPAGHSPGAKPQAAAVPPGGPLPNDVSGALYLVLKTQEITPDVFVCPDSPADPLSGGVQQHSNWPGRANLSYSYNNPYPSQNALDGGWKFNGTVGADFPVAADMNPGSDALLSTPYNASREQMKAVNSPNHGGDGQNVLYCDGHVDWQSTPYAGARRSGAAMGDNIYTYGVPTTGSAGTGIAGPAQDAYDAVLLPTWLEGPQPPDRPRGFGGVAGSGLFTPGLLALAGVAAVLLVVAVIVAVVVITVRNRAGGGGPPAGMPPPYGRA